MQDNRGWGAVLAAVIAVGLSSTGCQEARLAEPGEARASSTHDRPRTATTARAAPGATAPNGSSVTSGGGVTVAQTAPLASAALPEGVTRRAEQSVAAADWQGVVKANNAFAVALFGALRGEMAGSNFLTSPISASLALGMTYAGARGQTRTEMARALRFDRLSDERIASGQNALSQQLTQRGAVAFAAQAESTQLRRDEPPPRARDYSFELVNSLWGQTGYPWEPPFLKTLAENYGAALFQRDFAHQAQAARLEMNHWVSTHTQDKIQDLLLDGTVTPDTRLVLVNALHLKLPWADQFDESATRPEPFAPSGQKPLPVPFMHRKDYLSYRDDGSAQVVALPLSSRQLWLIIALPHARVSLASYERTLRADSGALVVTHEALAGCPVAAPG